MISKRHQLTVLIILGMLLGIALGEYVFLNSEKAEALVFADRIKLFTTIFLRLVQMIIAPLVFSTLVSGIAKMGDLKAVGRVGGKSMLWFISASLISLLLGLMLVNLFKPGVGVNLGEGDVAGAKDFISNSKGFSLQGFIEHVFPKSVIEAMATNEILQLVIFSIFFGVALTAIGEKAAPLTRALDTIGHVCLKMVGYIMWVAPFGVFGGVAAIVAKKGLGVLTVYGKYLGSFYLGLGVLWLVLLLAGFLILRKRLKSLLARHQQRSGFPKTNRRAGTVWLQAQNCKFCFAPGI